MAAVLVQFFLAGIGLPQLGAEGMSTHTEFGYVALHFTPLLLVIAAIVGRTGKTLIWLTVLLAVVAFVQPIWVAGFQGQFLASMHIIGAVAILVISYVVARDATRAARAQPAA